MPYDPGNPDGNMWKDNDGNLWSSREQRDLQNQRIAMGYHNPMSLSTMEGGGGGAGAGAAPGSGSAVSPWSGNDKGLAFYDYDPSRFSRSADSVRTGQMDQGEQQWMLQQMRERAFGQLPTGPSVAELQLQEGMRQRQNAAMSLLGGGGLNPAMARRQALASQEGAMGDFAQQQAILRAQEEAQRRGEQIQMQSLYGGLLGGMRGQNQQMSEADRQAMIELERLRGGQVMGINSLLTSQINARNSGNRDSTPSWVGPAIGAGGAVAGAAIGASLGGSGSGRDTGLDPVGSDMSGEPPGTGDAELDAIMSRNGYSLTSSPSPMTSGLGAYRSPLLKPMPSYRYDRRIA